MPPVDRRNPIRAASSESTCSLLEFAREFPDDEACLVWLWRERFAPDGEHAHCSRCGTKRVFKRYDTRSSWSAATCRASSPSRCPRVTRRPHGHLGRFGETPFRARR